MGRTTPSLDPYHQLSPPDRHGGEMLAQVTLRGVAALRAQSGELRGRSAGAFFQIVATFQLDAG